MPLTNYFNKQILNQLFGSIPMPVISSYYMALFTGHPLDTINNEIGAGGILTHGYTRVKILNSSKNFETLDPENSSIPNKKVNALPLTFPQATGDWGKITHFGFFEALTDGNLAFWAPLTEPAVVLNGNTAFFNSGDLTLSCA